VPDGLSIGEDLSLDARRFHVSQGGVTLVTRDMLRELDTRPELPANAPASRPRPDHPPTGDGLAPAA
jgi:hypothetical protein